MEFFVLLQLSKKNQGDFTSKSSLHQNFNKNHFHIKEKAYTFYFHTSKTQIYRKSSINIQYNDI